jgi:methyl-accepting chemotaxis protein
MRISIRTKLFVIAAIIVAIYGFAVSFMLVSFSTRLTDDAKELTKAYLNENASSAETIINGDFEIARTVASTLKNTIDLETSVREDVTGKILESTVAQSPRYLSAWLSMELSAIDPAWTKPYGRKRYTYYQAGVPIFDTVNQEGDVENSLYFQLKTSKKEELTEPYLLSSTQSVKDQRNNYLGTSICVPLVQDGKFIGLAGMDITLDALDFIAKMKPYEGASSFLVSNEGIIVSHENEKYIGKRLATLISSDTVEIFASIAKGEAVALMDDDLEVFVAFTPMSVGRSEKQWSIGTIVPMQAITSTINPILKRTILLSIGGLVLLVIGVLIVSSGITRPINRINERLKELAAGKIGFSTHVKVSNDEIGEMADSLQKLERNLGDKVNFAVDIGNGKFDSHFETASAEDKLGLALENMRTNLKQIREEEERRLWTNEGLAKLNDALRMSAASENFYHHVLKTILQFLNANQGAIFVVNEEEGDKYIDLVAAYAYGRQKHLNNRIAWGQSLIGQCILEGEMVYLREIPKQYIKITSGLGEATPTVLLILPLKTDVQALGAIEIATFKELQPQEIEFVKKAAQIVASGMNNLKMTASRSIVS